VDRQRIGTCSWTFPSWEGLVYERGDRSGEALLAEYAAQFNCVEIDRWFWSLGTGGKARLPQPSDVRAYRDAVPDGFRFGIKAPNSITLTHEYSKSKGDSLRPNPHFLSPTLACEFLDRIRPLDAALGPVMLQFEYLNRQKMPSRNAFFDALGAFSEALPAGFFYALEVRNARFIDAEFFRFLGQVSMAPVVISGYWMPPLADVWSEYEHQINRFDPVFRLMGPDRKRIEEETGGRWNRIVDPHDEELDLLSRMLSSLSTAGRQPFLFINNHYEGSAPLTITRLLDRLVANRSPVES